MISIYPTPGTFTNVNFPFSPVSPQRFSELASYVTTHTWSPIIYRENVRQEKNFSHSYIVGLDFDEGMTLGQATENIFCDMRHIIGTTRNHQKEKNGVVCDRFRVILQFERLISDLRTYKWNINRLVSHYESDENAKGASRLFFPCTEIVSKGDGYLVEVEEPPAWFMDNSAKEAELAAYAKLGDLPFWLKRNLANPIQQGNRNSAVFGMAMDLSKISFDRKFVESQLLESQVYKDNVTDRDFVRGFNSTINSIFRRAGK
jgi:hypothetical protein